MVDSEALGSATSILSHRGPDSGSIWLAKDGNAGLGHRRLSIIDLVGGRQPVHSEDGAIQAVVNGEFYGYESLRQDLIDRGHQFHTCSDSEVLVHLYEEYGLACLQHLRGEFAFILWDERRRELLAARDRFGIKPLFYAQHRGALYIASEVKAIFAAGVPAVWDAAAFSTQLLSYLTSEQTLFRGVQQLPASHYMVSDGNDVHISRYWDLDIPLEEGTSVCEDLVQDLKWHIEDAVKVRLRADVPVCSYLSGGIDSSTIFHIAAGNAPPGFCAFTIAFEDDDAFNEEEIARESASQAGVDLQVVPVGSTQLAHNLSDAVWHAETLGMNWHGVARFLLCQQIHRSGYKVALSGEGADEVFAGYVQFRQEVGPTNDVTDHRHNELVLRGDFSFVPAWLHRLAVSRSPVWMLLSESGSAVSIEQVYGRLLSQFDWEGQLTGRSPLRQSMYMWTRTILPNYTLTAERLEMAHAVETRIPFLDHKLFEFARTIPPRLLIAHGSEKYILREAVKPIVSRTVYQRPKHPFFSPPAASKQGGVLNELIQDTLRGDTLATFPTLDRRAIRGFADELLTMSPSMRASFDPIILLLVSASVLHDRLQLAW